MKKILALNSGSSSIKFVLFQGEKRLASGLVEQIGESRSYAKLDAIESSKRFEHSDPIKDHEEGLKIVASLFAQSGLLKDFSELSAVGHRVVHGSDAFFAASVVDERCMEKMQEASVLAPLHNPPNIAGIKTMQTLAPSVVNVAVFDTAYHQSMPAKAYRYAIPSRFYKDLKVRRYGFHGTSHAFVVKTAAKHLGADLDSFSAISMHLGNGASVAAIENGKTLDTSMGLTPLEGLVMGTRCGDIDPAALFYIAQSEGLSVAGLDKLCNKESGLLGLCGANDLRDIEARMRQGDEEAQLAFDVMIHRLRKYLGGYFALLPKCQALIFTAGIGENSSKLRSAVCKDLAHLGIILDEEKNENAKRGELSDLSLAGSKIKILVVPTDEELSIAQQTLALL